MGLLKGSNFTTRANETTAADTAAPPTGSRYAVTYFNIKCNTATTLLIYNGTTTSTLMSMELAAAEGLAMLLGDDNPLLFDTNASILFRISATGTASDIFYQGFSFIPGR